MEFRTMHGRKIHCGDIISNGKNIYEVQCISNGKAHCKRIEICEDERFYKTMEDVEFYRYEIGEMWEY